MPSNFDFVRTGWPAVAEEARRAEFHTYGDARSALFYARRAVELTVTWMYKADTSLTRPYQDDLSSMLHEPTFKQLVGPGLLAKLNLIRKQGNIAVHKSAPVTSTESLPIVRELFHVMIWFTTHYARSP